MGLRAGSCCQAWSPRNRVVGVWCFEASELQALQVCRFCIFGFTRLVVCGIVAVGLEGIKAGFPNMTCPTAASLVPAVGFGAI